MRVMLRFVVVGLALVAWLGCGRADEPMDGTFLAGRSCEGLLSIRKGTNPGHVITGPGVGYQLLARNQKQATHYRIEILNADPRERWVAAECGKVVPAAAPQPAPTQPAPAPAKPKPVELAYILALSWQPAFCETSPKRPECRWQTGQRYDANYLSLHGLWPQPSSLQYCNLPAGLRTAAEGGRWKDIPAIELSMSTRADLETMMPSSKSLLDRHEWAKHGSCYPANAEAYFKDSLRLLKAVNASPVADLFMRNIGRRLTTADIRAAFDQAFGNGAGQRVRVACKDVGNRRLIAEITIGLKGDLSGGTGLPDLMRAATTTDPGCPAGILDTVGTQ